MDGRAQMTHVRVLKPHCGSAMALQRGCSGEAGGGFVLVLELLGERGLVKLGESPPKPLPSYPKSRSEAQLWFADSGTEVQGLQRN